MKYCTLLDPPGAGGSWLISTLHQLDWNQDQPHFHNVWRQPELMQNIHHRSLTNHQPQNLVVFGGVSWFNFYLNIIYKLYYLERAWLTADRTHFLINKMIELVSVIREHERYTNDFEWEWLFSDQPRLYQTITQFQLQHAAAVIDCNNFEQRAQHYIQTCVNPVLIFEDWNNLYWVCAVLGLARYQSHQLDLSNCDLYTLSCQARALYAKLDAVPCANTKTNLMIPSIVT